MISKKFEVAPDKQEFIKPILPGLPISVFVTVFNKTSYTYVNWHWHEAFQYCVVTEGAVEFLFLGQKRIVTAGNGIFINYQQTHFIKNHDDNVPASYLCIDIPPSFISYDDHSRIFLKYLKPIMHNPLPPSLPLAKNDPDDQQILNNVTAIHSLLKSEKELIEIDIRIKVMTIWKLTYLKLQQNTTKNTYSFYDNDRLKAIILFIQKNYETKLTLNDIARHVALSRSECSRFFKKLTGDSIFGYLMRYRINKSIDLLRDTDDSIAAVANAVGFSSQSYFTNCFYKEKKITPKKYKELATRKAKSVLSVDT